MKHDTVQPQGVQLKAEPTHTMYVHSVYGIM